MGKEGVETGMTEFMGIVQMIDAQLLRRHNNTATEFFEAGQQAEQERIIKLLEENYLKFYSDDGLKDMVTLIKGENK